MTVEIAFFNLSGLLSRDLEAQVRSGIGDAIALLGRHADLRGTGIAVHLCEIVSQWTGLGGIANGPDSCAIHVDPGCEALSRDTRHNAGAVVVHELHHVLRMRHRSLPRYAGLCAGDVLVLEGLATQCEVFLGFGEGLTVRDVPPGQVQDCLSRIAPVVGDPGADWAWIYDRHGFAPQVYRAMYPMGHAVVGTYLARTGRTPMDAVGTPWEEVWRGSVAC